ncbi:ABC transporter permease [Limnochorda pilosa]|uniref:Peptide ABC transporter permease n=1 Tax=Limnochorda pilosa TaxID=1555112 RepID=A0A0K2SKB4_LIMPI|nr:ABC transporter permease [Limnochorda pilosa]BAS27274.1 peptide ABC transporter permease [Limnochorda pilosa]
MEELERAHELTRRELLEQLEGEHETTNLSAWQLVWREFRKNRLAVVGGVVVLLLVAVALGAPWIAPHDPTRIDPIHKLQPPAWMEGGSWSHPLGTDHLGRDLLSRMIYGSRVSLAVGAVVVLVATSLGVVAGLVSGFFGGVADTVIQRLVEILLAFPYLVLAIALMAVMGPGLTNLFLALVYKEWVTPARVVRAEVLAVKQREYVEAARALGAGPFRIMFRQILPNVLASAVVIATLRVAWVILMESSLSFLGLGVQPPTPSWGTIIADGRSYVFQQWWISTFPGLAILLTVLAINLLGEGLRDALDPRLRE